MTTSRISLALFIAFAIGTAAPLLSQAANDDPNAEPSAGDRIPASADTPQHSGDSSRDQPGAVGQGTVAPSGEATGQRDPSAGDQEDATVHRRGSDADASHSGSANPRTPGGGSR